MPTLREIRRKKVISQAELAKVSGVAEGTISRIETGKHVPQFVTIRKLAKALGVEPGDIAFGKGLF